MIVNNPKSCIIELWACNQKSASLKVPGTCGEYCQAMYPGTVANAVKTQTKPVIDESHWCQWSAGLII
jgi:hypothetical protein